MQECVYVCVCVCVRVCICRMKPRENREIVSMLTAVNEAWISIQRTRGLTAAFETMFKEPNKFATIIAPAAPAATPPRGSKGKDRGAGGGGAMNDSRVGGTAAVPAAAPPPPPVSPTGGGGVSSGGGGRGRGRGGGAEGAGAGSRVEGCAAVPPTTGAAPAGNAGRTSAMSKRQSEEDANTDGSVCLFPVSTYLFSHHLCKHAAH